MKWTTTLCWIMFMVQSCFSAVVRTDAPLVDPSLLLASFAQESGQEKTKPQRSCSSTAMHSEPGVAVHVSTSRLVDIKSPGASLPIPPTGTSASSQALSACPVAPSPTPPERDCCRYRPSSSLSTTSTRASSSALPICSASPTLPLNQTEDETTSPTEEEDNAPSSSVSPSVASNSIPLRPSTLPHPRDSKVFTRPPVTLVSTLTTSVSVSVRVPMLTTSVITSPSPYIITSLQVIVSTTVSHVPTVLPTTLTVKEPAPPPSTLVVPSLSYLLSTVQVPTTVLQTPSQQPTPIIQYTIVQYRKPPLTRTRVFIRPVTVAVPVTRTAVSTSISDHTASVLSVSTVISEKTVTVTQSVTAKESITLRQQSILTTREKVGYPIAVPVPMEVRLSTQVAIATPSYSYFGPGNSYGNQGGSNNALASAAPALSRAAQSLLNQQIRDGNLAGSYPTQGYMGLVNGDSNRGAVSTLGYGPLYPVPTGDREESSKWLLDDDGMGDESDTLLSYNPVWYPAPTLSYQTEEWAMPTNSADAKSGLVEKTQEQSPRQGNGWITPSLLTAQPVSSSSSSLTLFPTSQTSQSSSSGSGNRSSMVVYTTVTRSRSTTSA